jgi:hypothetical protein
MDGKQYRRNPLNIKVIVRWIWDRELSVYHYLGDVPAHSLTALAQLLSQITENRKVEPCKSLIFPDSTEFMVKT